MSRTARWLLAVIAVQAALIGLYWAVEHNRARAPKTTGMTRATEPPQRVDMTMPQLTVRRRDGSAVAIPSADRPMLVHFWATWCPPCRAELPGLLALPAAHPVDVVAIALDSEWTRVDSFLAGFSAADVVLGNAREIESKLGVRTLPVTLLLRPGGKIVYRFDGARDWTNAAYVAAWTRP